MNEHERRQFYLAIAAVWAEAVMSGAWLAAYRDDVAVVVVIR